MAKLVDFIKPSRLKPCDVEVDLFEVGGSIRDELLGIDSNDKDFVAVCPDGWDALLEWADSYFDKVFLIEPKFFTIRGKKGEDILDVVMARKEGDYTDGRRPDECEPGTLEDDLARRDFTMNAIAKDPSTGELIDPYDGQQDIKDRRIRCRKMTSMRIKEDALRILRAIRFHITLSFGLSEELWDIIGTNRLTNQLMSDLIDKSVSRERVREELVKMFKHDWRRSMRFFTNDSASVMMENLYPDPKQVIHVKLANAIFGDDIWLKPTVEQR
jgi:tRNA nucleotidyltransferase/poly(A) polymerase